MIDLVAHRIEDLTIILTMDESTSSGRSSIFSELVSLGGRQSESQSPTVMFMSEFTKSRRRQHVTLAVMTSEEDDDVNIVLHCRRGARRSRQRDRFAPVEVALNYLGARH